MIRGIILWLLFSSCLAGLVNCKLTDVVNTACGKVQGKIEMTRPKKNEMAYSAFYGIPYAKPPVGHLRFHAPQPPQCWQDVLNATKEGSICSQLDNSSNYHGSEDCLNLNVYVPRTDFKNITFNLAVLFFIYGGSFATGSNEYEMFGPDYIMFQDVILVVPNYRLGVLGFGCYPGIVCNCALRDQNLALRWVRDNIRNFGGNPNEVTLFGQSAGAVSVHSQILSPMGKGLFARAMLQSGSLFCGWGYHSPAVAKSYVQKLADAIANSSLDESNTLSVLKAASAEMLIRKTHEIYPVSPSFKVTSDKYQNGTEPFLPDCPYNIMKSGGYNQVSIIMGYVLNEALSFVNIPSLFEQYSNIPFHDFTNDTTNVIPKIVGNAFRTATNRISKHVIKEVVDVGTDILFKSCIDLTQRMFAEKLRHKLYYYVYDYNGMLNVHREVYGINLNGVGHGDDLGEEFYIKVLHPFPKTESVSSEMNQVAYNFTCLIGNFGKTGSPTPPHRNCSKDEWPDSREHAKMMNISTELTVVSWQINNRTKTAEELLYGVLNGDCDC